jgi:hypothetical protein
VAAVAATASALTGGTTMGLLDDAKKFIDEHDDKVDDAIEKAGDLVDDKTGGKFADKVDKAQDIAQEKTGDGDTAR